MTKLTRRELLSATAAAGATSIIGVGSASAQAWPARPVTVVCAFFAGGGKDST